MGTPLYSEEILEAFGGNSGGVEKSESTPPDNRKAKRTHSGGPEAFPPLHPEFQDALRSKQSPIKGSLSTSIYSQCKGWSPVS